MKSDGKQEIVVFSIRSRDAVCSECKKEIGKGALLRKEGEKGLCMECADLGDLVFLGAGDHALTRRASKYSPLRAVVLRWSTTRKQYERQGILVDPDALDRAEEECLEDAELRERRRIRAAVGREKIDARYVAEFARRVRERYPSAPPKIETEIAAHACRKYSGRVGRSAAAKEFDPEMIDLAVRAHIRHTHTSYDALLSEDTDRQEARSIVRSEVDAIAAKWRG